MGWIPYFVLGICVRFALVVGNAALREGDSFPVLSVTVVQFLFFVSISILASARASLVVRAVSITLCALGFALLGTLILRFSEPQLEISPGVVLQLSEIAPSTVVVLGVALLLHLRHRALGYKGTR